MNLVDAGLFYLKKGMPVFPFKSDKSTGLVKWEQYQQVFPSPDDVRGWFTKRFSNQFIAIVTGKISRMMVVDCDTPEAYEKVQELLPDGFLCPTVKSPHGWHLYFQFREGLRNKAAYMPGVDVRTEGGCIIAPPSMNGDGLGYKWLPGLSMEKIDLPPMPSLLFDTLMQYVVRGGVGGIYKGAENSSQQTSTLSTNVNKLFCEGTRDQDIFHLANCMAKGGYEKQNFDQVLSIIAKNCKPPFDEKEIPAKIESAFNRKSQRSGKLVDEVREFVLSTNGIFLSKDVHKCLNLSTREDQKNLSTILSRMQHDGMIEKVGNRNGEWRLVDQNCKPMDWINADCAYKELWLPLGLDRICGVQPGNILLVAGAKDSGKTAFLMNIAKENRYAYRVHYFNSEMGAAEFKMRASKFEEPISLWKDVSVYERSENFADVIKPGEGNLNIIDFLEVVDEFWKVAATIQKIHQKLNGALCVIGLQKNPHVDLGRGGAFSLEKARLYLSLDYQKAKIVSCKNFKENDIIEGNPRGYTCKFTLASGCIIRRQPPGWTNEMKETK